MFVWCDDDDDDGITNCTLSRVRSMLAAIRSIMGCWPFTNVRTSSNICVRQRQHHSQSNVSSWQIGTDYLFNDKHFRFYLVNFSIKYFVLITQRARDHQPAICSDMACLWCGITSSTMASTSSYGTKPSLIANCCNNYMISTHVP